MSKKQVTALRLRVNVRRGPSSAASIIGTLKVGESLVMVGNPMNLVEKGTWAQVEYPGLKPGEAAYVCVAMANGSALCEIRTVDSPSAPSAHDASWEAEIRQDERRKVLALVTNILGFDHAN